jgi:hypothetical protein
MTAFVLICAMAVALAVAIGLKVAVIVFLILAGCVIIGVASIIVWSLRCAEELDNEGLQRDKSEG